MAKKAEVEDKSTQPEAGKRQEVKKKPVESLADAIAGALTSILKVKDLRGAMHALVEAQKLKDDGKLTESRDLALKIFQRLKQIGTDTSELPPREDVERLVNQGEYGLLSKLVGEKRAEIEVKGDGGRWKQSNDRAKRVEDGLDELEIEKKKRLRAADIKNPGSVAELSKLPAEAADKVGERVEQLATTETELSKQVEERLSELVKQLGGELKVSDRKKLEKEWDATLVEMKLAGRAELSLEDVTAAREKMVEVWQEIAKNNEQVVGKVRKSVLEEQKKSPRKISNLEKSMARAFEERGFAAAVVGRTKELAGILEKIEGKLKLGSSFEQACEGLKPGEIESVRQWLGSLGKKEGQVGYDAVLSTIGEEIMTDPSGWRVLERFLQNVEENYDEKWRRTTEQEAARVTTPVQARERTRGGQPLVINQETGNPYFGLPEGASGMSQRGLDFLREVSGDAEWVQDWLKAETAEQYKQMQEKQHSVYRAEMMNVSFDALMADEGVSQEFKDLLDVEAFSKGQVARIKAEFRNDPEKRARFQALWLQEMLYSQRLIAYEGVFQGAHYDARITRYNTLMSIMDISTSIKGYAKLQGQAFSIVDTQQNSYLDEAALEALIKPLLAQGPDFRVEHMFKTNREGIYVMDGNGVRRKIGDIGLYDVVHKLKMRVEDTAERSTMEMPERVSRHYGTMMERHSEDALRTRNRKTVFFSLMRDLGVDFAGVDDFQKDMVYNMYQSYLDEGVYYMWTKKQLHQAVGNASFEEGKFELCQALPEMLYKTDPFLVLKYFQKYSVGGQLKDAFVFGDSGMRDQVTMAHNDYAQHLLEADTNTLGAPGIRQVFFGGKRDKKTDEYIDWFAKTMDEAIFHYGFYDKNRKVTMSARIGNAKERKSGTRRPDAEIIDILRGKTPPAGFVEALDWGTKENPGAFAKLVVDPKLVEKLTSTKLNKRQKWDVFINRFGEDYLNMESAGAKRVEHMSKYGLTQHFTWYKNYLAWQLAAVNNTKIIDMFTPLAAVNSAIAPIIGENHLEFQSWGNEQLGRKELGGGKTKRVKRNQAGLIQFDTSYGFLGSGDSEWPGLNDEEIRNDRGYLDPVQRRSVFEASGVAGYQDEFAMKNLAEDMFRAGLLTEEAYKRWYKKEFVGNLFWAKKKGLLPNLWNWATGDVLFEYMGNIWFGIPGHMLREAWGEPTKKQLEGLWKYFSS